jgi:hypothetical protein
MLMSIGFGIFVRAAVSFATSHLLHLVEALGWMEKVSQGIRAIASLDTEYRPDSIRSAIRLIDVLRNAVACKEITASWEEIDRVIGQFCRFQVAALNSGRIARADMTAAAVVVGGRMS